MLLNIIMQGDFSNPIWGFTLIWLWGSQWSQYGALDNIITLVICCDFSLWYIEKLANAIRSIRGCSRVLVTKFTLRIERNNQRATIATLHTKRGRASLCQKRSSQEKFETLRNILLNCVKNLHFQENWALSASKKKKNAIFLKMRGCEGGGARTMLDPGAHTGPLF